jgi:hypothetical protein
MDEIEKNPLQVAYNAAILVVGRQAANDVCKAHGVTDNGLHPWRRVPDNKAKACLAALEKLAGSSHGAEKAAAGFQKVRRESFANICTEERKPAPAAKRLDPDAIYSRWNSAVRPNED